jgi:hypothetical protein
MTSILISLWLLVGCLYIPTGDNVHLSGTKKDFRPLVGQPGSHQPITAGSISRGQIERLLGPPPFQSDDHSRAMYVLHVKKGIIIFPACFTATDDADTGIGLLLIYGSNGGLLGWRRLESKRFFDPIETDPFGIYAGQFVQSTVDDELIMDANDAPTTRASDQPPQANRWRLRR